MTIMNILWVVLLVALTGAQFGYGLPVRPTPQAYPRDASQVLEGWDTVSGVYAALPALALVLTAVGFLLGCTWCYRHKDCKLFTASATHLHDNRRTNPPDSGFSEPANNNISEDNNNGPISLREMQNIANNNAAAYIVSENEERNRISRESVVEFEPLPTELRVADPLERCADWFSGEDFPRNQLQYLREIGRGWFGRVVEGEVDDAGPTKAVAVKILNPNANLEDKARFLDEAKLYRDSRHDTILGYVARCLQEDPWIVIFELCSTDLHQYLTVNRPKMAILNESGVPLRLMCDVTSGLSYLNSRGHLYGNLWSGNVLVRGEADNARAVLGRYTNAESPYEHDAPETRRHPPLYTVTSKPDLYPLVITYGDSDAKSGGNYLMVHYFRNYVIRAPGSLSAASTAESLNSSFLCNATNEANSVIPPPYSCASNYEECGAVGCGRSLLRSLSSLTEPREPRTVLARPRPVPESTTSRPHEPTIGFRENLITSPVQSLGHSYDFEMELLDCELYCDGSCKPRLGASPPALRSPSDHSESAADREPLELRHLFRCPSPECESPPQPTSPTQVSRESTLQRPPEERRSRRLEAAKKALKTRKSSLYMPLTAAYPVRTSRISPGARLSSRSAPATPCSSIVPNLLTFTQRVSASRHSSKSSRLEEEKDPLLKELETQGDHKF